MQDPYRHTPPPPPPTDPLLNNDRPIPDDKDSLQGSPYLPLLENIQGNILKGHGRDHSANIFFKFPDAEQTRSVLKELFDGKYITTAITQIRESRDYKQFKIPGKMFGNLFLTANGYRMLGFSDDRLNQLFNDVDEVPPNAEAAFPQPHAFLKGMKALAADLGDIPAGIENIPVNSERFERLSPIQKKIVSNAQGIENTVQLEPLEQAYFDTQIHAMLLLADDDEKLLLKEVRELLDYFNDKDVTVLAVELGKALRNNDDEGIEHFGYVDGRSQPLFLKSDFRKLSPDGQITPDSKEKINEKATRKESGDIDVWNPFEKLNIVLMKDSAVEDPNAYGSYFVFRKLEQDVLRFSMAEQQLADRLKLDDASRERAGAMAVGRFRDGTPLVLSDTDGFIPAKANNFRYDGLDAKLIQRTNAADLDQYGLKCPFQAHIRKTNPRQSVQNLEGAIDPAQVKKDEDGDRARRITRRGIPYGERKKNPDIFQSLNELPAGDVGLLFACFQQSIVRQFAFMQKTWANNVKFKVPLINDNPSTGLDPLIGQPLDGNNPASSPKQHWRKEYGGDPGQQPANLTEMNLTTSHPIEFEFQHFIKFRGGEFFFTPSIPFFKQLDNIQIS